MDEVWLWCDEHGIPLKATKTFKGGIEAMRRKYDKYGIESYARLMKVEDI